MPKPALACLMRWRFQGDDGHLAEAVQAHMIVNIRLTHAKTLAGEHCVIIAAEVMRQHTPATRDAVSAPVGQTHSAGTRLGSSGFSRWIICWNVGKATRRNRY